ncbi:glycosyl hydrolase 53 family protein [Croceimicrobium sp.]|uniref:glycosyl hydrolase 53 family protein n=1 Tax=Croceimicrobium sp. TaxID=2828340 RepID=UPI003BAD3CD3
MRNLKWMIPISTKHKAFLMGGFFYFLLASLILSGCRKNEAKGTAKVPDSNTKDFYRAADLSSWPEISAANLSFFKADGEEGEFLDILQDAGINTVRLRLWVDPAGPHSSFSEVDSFAQVLQNRGLKVWLSVHCTDHWADPSNQEIPTRWSNLSFAELQDSLYQYFARISAQIQPDIIQIGNEINPGLLMPFGSRWEQLPQFRSLIDTASAAIRRHSPESEIMLHCAGPTVAPVYFLDLKDLDFDLIGISYYPIWHGKSFFDLTNVFNNLDANLKQGIMIAETAYPFTLDWNDWTNNIVGLPEQLIDTIPASPAGQKQFLTEIRAQIEAQDRGRGFCYWGGELIAWKGPQGENASPWENQALFDFNRKALPVLEVFAP